MDANTDEFSTFVDLVQFLKDNNLLLSYNNTSNKSEFLATHNAVYCKELNQLDDCDDYQTIVHYLGKFEKRLIDVQNAILNKGRDEPLTNMEKTILARMGMASQEANNTLAYEQEIKEVKEEVKKTYKDLEEFEVLSYAGTSFSDLEKDWNRDSDFNSAAHQVPVGSLPIALHDIELVRLFNKAKIDNQIILIAANKFKSGFAITYLENKLYDADVFERNVERVKELIFKLLTDKKYENIGIINEKPPQFIFNDEMESAIQMLKKQHGTLTEDMETYERQKLEFKNELQEYENSENAYCKFDQRQFKELLQKDEDIKETWNLIFRNLSAFSIRYSDSDGYNPERIRYAEQFRWTYVSCYMMNILDKKTSTKVIPKFTVNGLPQKIKKTTIGSFLTYYQTPENANVFHSSLFEFKVDAFPQGWRNNLKERLSGMNLISLLTLVLATIVDIDMGMFAAIDLLFFKWLLLIRSANLSYFMLQMHNHYPFKDKLVTLLPKLAYYVLLCVTNNDLLRFDEIKKEVVNMIKGTTKFNYSHQLSKRLGSTREVLVLDNGKEFQYGDAIITKEELVYFIRGCIFNSHNWSVQSYLDITQFISRIDECKRLLRALGLDDAGIEADKNIRPTFDNPRTPEMIQNSLLTHKFIDTEPNIENAYNTIVSIIGNVELDMNKVLESYNKGNNQNNLVERIERIGETKRPRFLGINENYILMTPDSINYKRFYDNSTDERTEIPHVAPQQNRENNQNNVRNNQPQANDLNNDDESEDMDFTL